MAARTLLVHHADEIWESRGCNTGNTSGTSGVWNCHADDPFGSFESGRAEKLYPGARLSGGYLSTVLFYTPHQQRV